jgi:uncharacterized protein (TIGR03435 family)
MRYRYLSLLTAALFAGSMFAQAPANPSLAFEVASIKPAQPFSPAQAMGGKFRLGMSIDGARVDIGNLSLKDLLTIAYSVKNYQVSGPDWLAGQRFDIVAKLPEGATRDQVPAMLQALLAERFHLVVRQGSKEQSVYALVVGKGGPKLKESDGDAAAADAPPVQPPPGPGSLQSPDGAAPPPPRGGGAVTIARDGVGVRVSGGGQLGGGGMRIMAGPNGAMHLETNKITMARFSDMLGNFLDRPVVDETGLKGNYQVALDLSLDEMRNAAKGAGIMLPPGAGMGRGGEPGKLPGAEASDPSGSSIFTTVQQLGLKLEPRKESLGTVVVESGEKMPTEN